MEEQLKIDFEKNLKNLSYSDQEKNFKENNFKEFLKQGFPNRKLENWKFSDLNQIIKSKKIKINRTLNSQKFQKYSGYNKKSWKLMLNTYKEYSKR